MSLHTFMNDSRLSVAPGYNGIIQGISNGLKVIGLTRLNASHGVVVGGTYAGATDFTGVTAPGTTNTINAWEIWAFADSLQAQTPIYIFFQYGTGATVAVLGLTITVGTQLNNANPAAATGLAGQVFTQQMNTSSGQDTTTLRTCFVSGTTSRMAVGLFVETPNSDGYVMCVERLHASDGTDNAEGAFVMVIGPGITNAPANQVIHPINFGANAAQFGLLAGVWPFSNVTVWGTDFHVTPIFPQRGRCLPPSRNVMGANYTDVAIGSTIVLPLYGANRNWIAFHGPRWSNLFLSGSTAILLVRFE